LICDWLSILFTQAGAQFLDGRDKAVFNTMGGTEALQWMVELLYTHHAADPASLESTEDDVRKALQTGTYALTYNWEGVLPEANDPAQSWAAPNIRVSLLPGGNGAKSASVSGSEGWAILAHSKRKAAAWKLLEYMASPVWQTKAAIVTGNYPILTFWTMYMVILADAWKTVPTMTLLLLAGLQTISHELYDAAEADGATRWQTFIGITVPLLRPVILVAVALRTIGAFRAFDIIYVLTGNGGPADSTKVLAFYAYDQAFHYLFFGYGAAVSWLITACMLVWIMLYLRLLRTDIGT
jgi:hypothetical protein